MGASVGRVEKGGRCVARGASFWVSAALPGLSTCCAVSAEDGVGPDRPVPESRQAALVRRRKEN